MLLVAAAAVFGLGGLVAVGRLCTRARELEQTLAQLRRESPESDPTPRSTPREGTRPA